MLKFVPFSIQDAKSTDALNKKIGADFISHSHANFIEAFNQDVRVLNTLLEEPLSYKALVKKGAQLEVEYNALIEVGQKRWENSEKRFEVGANAIRNLAAIKKEYNEALHAIRSYDAKRANVRTLIYAGRMSIWEVLETKAKEIDALDQKDRFKKLRALRKDWTNQGPFAAFDSGDLIYYLDELYDFRWFLNLIKKSLKSTNQVSSEDYQVCLKNEETIKQYEKMIMSAMGWRLKAASMKRNLYFDDGYWALVDGLTHLLGKDLLLSYKIKQLDGADSYGLGPSRYLTLSRILLDAKNRVDREKVFQSFWVTNKQLPLKLTRHGDNIVPEILKSSIPLSRGWSPISWIRYYFFKVGHEPSPFWSWIKKLLVGTPTHAVIILNDTVWQTEQLRQNQKEFPELSDMIAHPGFKASLSLHKILAFERLRIDRFKLPWVIRVFLKIPFLNNATTDLIDHYLTNLKEIQNAVESDGKALVAPLLKRLNLTLTTQIKDSVYLMPKDLIEQLRHFVGLYGTRRQKSTLEKYVSPVYLLKHFNFFMPDEEQPYFRKLNKDSVDAFLRYAEKYWSEDNISAAYHLMDIVSGANIPKNRTDEQKLAKVLSKWFPEKNAQKETFELLQWVAETLVSRVGNLSDPFSFRFLKRFAPSKAAIWREEKEQDLDEKFTKVVSLFRKKNGQEVNLQQDEAVNYGTIRKFIHDLTFDLDYKKRYMPGLFRRAGQYIDQFNGQEDAYTIVIYWLCKTNKDMTLFYRFFKKRLEALLALEQPMTSSYENALLGVLKNDKQILDIFQLQVEDFYEGETLKLLPILRELGNADLLGSFFAKRFMYLHQKDDKDNFHTDRELFNPFKLTPAFQDPVSHYLELLMKTYLADSQWEQLCDPNFNELIEKYGHLKLKEKYRLARIEQLFLVKDKPLIDEYLLGLVKNLPDQDFAKAFTQKTSITALAQLFSNQANLMVTRNDWHGNWQYIVEHFQYKPCQPAQELTRFAWFNEFVFFTGYFASQSLMKRNTQDLNSHFSNIVIPNDQISMKDFYGSCLDHVIQQCFRRIDQMDPNMDNQVIQLFERYFHDEAVREHPSFPEYRKKFNILMKAKRFSSYMGEKNYDGARLYLDAIYDDFYAMQTQAAEQESEASKAILGFQKQMIINLETFLGETYCALVVPINWLTRTLEEQVELQSSKHLIYFEEALLSNRDSPFGDPTIGFVSDNRIKIQKLMQALLGILSLGNFEAIDLSYDAAQCLNVGLCVEVKRKLQEKILTVSQALIFDEQLSDVVRAYFRVVAGDYDNESAKQDDKLTLDKFESHSYNKQLLANNYVQSLLGTFEEQAWDVFNRTVQLDEKFVLSLFESADNRQLRALSQKLQAHIEALFNHSDMAQVKLQKEHWVCCNILYNLLRESGVITSAQAKLMFQSTALSLNVCDELHTRFMKTMSDESHQDLRLKDFKQDEHKIMLNALRVRVYGHYRQQKQLDAMLETMAHWQRIAVMSISKKPLDEHRLNYAFDLIDLTGNEDMRLSNARLKQVWSTYQGSPTVVNSKKVQRRALLESIPEFVNDFNEHLFDYFIDKFGLTQDRQAHRLLRRLDLEREICLNEPSLMSIEQIEKKYPLAYWEKLLTRSIGKVGIWQKVMHAPKERHARQLMATFCLSVRAAQLGQVWHKKLEADKLSSHAHFSCDVMAKPLLKLLDELKEDHHLESQTLIDSIVKAISIKSDFFDAWQNEYKSCTKKIQLRA